jgi:ABC-type lipoprotein export system ATPase subunit
VHVYRVAGTDVAALRGIDLVVPPGQRLALLGPSGSGKSTLLSIAAGVMRPSAGRIEVFGTELGTAKERTLRRIRSRDLGMMLQGAETNLLLFESIAGNIRFAISAAGHGDARIAERVLAAGGLDDDHRPVSAMTPAQQQVVALAVAMCTRPRLLLVDEPTSHLDDEARDRLLDVLSDVTTAEGTAVLVVTHDEAVARRMHRIVHLFEGRVAEEVTDSGRYAVIGADRALQLPDITRDMGWTSGALVSIDVVDDTELRITRVTPGDPRR